MVRFACRRPIGFALLGLGWFASWAAAAPPLATRPCFLDGLDEAVRCGVLEVPEDRLAQSPPGRTVAIHFAVVPARRRQARPDPLVLLAGGPGQGSLGYARLVAPFFREVRRSRDLLLIDLRGTGESGALVCAGQDQELASLARPSELGFDAEHCLGGGATDPRLYTTLEQVRDLDAVREALGYREINLWGGSYGTRTALLYSREFPDRVRSLVLDGAVPLEQRFPLSVAADSQRALDRLLADCQAEAACHQAFPTLKDELEGLFSRLSERPERVSFRHPRTGQATELELGKEAFAQALRGVLYSPRESALLPWAIHRAAGGDFAPLLAMSLEVEASSLDTMALGLTATVLCSEDLPRLTEADIDASSQGSFLGRSMVDAWQGACRACPRGPLPPRVAELLLWIRQ